MFFHIQDEQVYSLAEYKKYYFTLYKIVRQIFKLRVYNSNIDYNCTMHARCTLSCAHVSMCIYHGVNNEGDGTWVIIL